MDKTTIEEYKNQSVLINFFGQDKTKYDNKNTISFMNDDCFVKRLSENYVEANKYDLKGMELDKRWNKIESICISEISGGTNVQFADGQVWERNDLNSKEGHSISEKSIRKARATLVREHTDKINDKYVLLVHPDIAEQLKKEKFFCVANDEKLKKL